MSGLINVRDHKDPATGADWTPAFAAAIDAAVTGARGGVLVPADPEPYSVHKPGPSLPSIDLSGRTGFSLVGEGSGSRIQLAGSGLGGSWNMIRIAGDCVDVTVRDLYLDGNTGALSDLDDGQHTHTIQIGGGRPIASARRVRVLDCTMTDMDGDGVAIVGDGPFGDGQDVSVVDIIGCTFLNCRRSGVSNQRSAEFIRIHRCHFEGTSDQDIDFEPSGATPDTGPRRYSIVGNRFIHRTPAAAVTLSGLAGDIPAVENVFAFNQVCGGRVGMIDTRGVLLFGNHIESGLADGGAVLTMRGTTDDARISHNQLVRVPGAAPGLVIDIASRAIVSSLKGFDHVADTLTLRSHRRQTGAGPVRLTTTGTLPAELSTTTDYWLIRIDADTLRLATSPQNATNGVAVAFSDNGSGRASVRFPSLTAPLEGFDHLTDALVVTAHARVTGTGPVELASTGTLPTGLEPGTPYWLIRVDQDTLQLATSRSDAVAGTAVAFSDNGVGDHRLIVVDRPRGLNITHNSLHTHGLAGNGNATVRIRNADDCHLTGNEITSHSPGTIPSAIRISTEGALLEPATNWTITDNRIRGHADDGNYTDGVTVAPAATPVAGVTVSSNVFQGCVNQIRWSGSPALYVEIPTASGNSGTASDFADLANVEAVRIAGNASSQADYIYAANDEPRFPATDGSLARRRIGGGVNSTLYVRETGIWRGL